MGPINPWPATVRIFLATAVAGFSAVMLFWVCDGWHALWPRPSLVTHVWASAIVGAGLALGVSTAALGLKGTAPRTALALATPLAVLIAQAVFAWWHADLWGFDHWAEGMIYEFRWWATLLVVGGTGAVGLLVGVVEWRFLGGWGRTASLLFSFLWAYAAFQNLGLLMPVHLLLQIVRPRPAHTYALVIVASVWIVAVAARLAWRRQRGAGIALSC